MTDLLSTDSTVFTAGATAGQAALVSEPAHPNLPRKYLIGVLYYGAVDREHDRCVQALHKHRYVHDVFELSGCPYIDIGRSLIATAVLDDPSIGGLLFIDHDMVFDPSEVEKVIESAEAHAGTVGAAYSMRCPGRIIGAVDGTKLEPGKRVVFFQGGEVLPANYLGMGMTAIHRSVLERLVQASKERHARQQANLAELTALLKATFEDAGSFTPLRGPTFDSQRPLELLAALIPELKIPDLPRLSSGLSEAPVVPFFSLLQRIMPQAPAGMDGYYFGEDVSFCIRNHEAKVPVLLDTRARVFHKGSYCYGIEDVGMQVPWCDRLEAVDTADPVMKSAWFSPDAAVQKALHAEHPEAPESVSARTPFDVLPLSYDPTAPKLTEAGQGMASQNGLGAE